MRSKPAPENIAVWILELDATESALKTFDPGLDTLLTDEERARASRFIHKPAALRFLFGRCLLRCALSAHHAAQATPPSAWRFVQKKNGKPELARAFANTELKFNLSHSADIVACAVTTQLEVGIDVEHLERNIDVMSVSTYCFSPHEIADLQATAPAQRHRRFLHYWTLKEAYVKARGDGLTYPLTQVTFHQRPDGCVSLIDENDDAARDFRFVQLADSERFVAALCWRQTGSDEARVLKVIHTTPAEMLELYANLSNV